MSDFDASMEGSVAFHDNCSASRELGIHEQPRALLSSIDGLSLKELPEGTGCCGFGGGACAPPSGTITDDISEAGAGMLLSADLGCLIGMARKLKRDGSAIEVRH